MEYLQEADMSTPQSRAQAFGDAAEAARRDGRKKRDQAERVRASAGVMEEKGLHPAAARLRREAVALDDTAEVREGMARQFQEAVDRELATA